MLAYLLLIDTPSMMGAFDDAFVETSITGISDRSASWWEDIESGSMASMLRGIAATPDILPELELEEGTVVDSAYRIVERLGSGGMGVVYLARDIRLNRLIALKFHRSGVSGQSPEGTQKSPEACRARMIREAKAMARLSHPNVVTVHEVGMYEGLIYIAMEFVDGKNARELLTEKPSGREVLEVFIAAGRGLAAAHEADLIHRDFKPDNILIGKEGRVRVADFGLARFDRKKDPEEAEHVAYQDNLTLTHGAMGTPAYMAPEQYRLQGADERSDQFSFAVALYESLFGKRPFFGNNVVELLDAIDAGRLQDGRPLPQTPAGVLRVLRRGMKSDPNDRYASLEQLLDNLERTLGVRSRAAVAGSAALLMGLASLVGMWSASSPCAEAGGAIDAVWNPVVASRMHRSLSQGAVAGTASRTVSLMNRYAVGWAEERTRACAATRVDGVQSQELEQRMQCLDQHQRDFAALVEQLQNKKVAKHAVRAVMALPEIAECGHARFVDPVDLSHQRALVSTGQTEEALAQLSSLEQTFSVLLVKAQAEMQSSSSAAVETLQSAYFAARAEGLDREAAKIATLLVERYAQQEQRATADRVLKPSTVNCRL